MARRPPFRPPPAPAPRPAYPTGNQSQRGKPGMYIALSGGTHLQQNLVLSPRIRETVDEAAVETATMLPQE